MEMRGYDRLAGEGGGLSKRLKASVTEINKGGGGKTRGSTKMSVTPGENNSGSVATIPSITLLALA